MNILVRRIEMKDNPLRADVRWLLFEEGNIDRPILCLTDFEMKEIILEVETQDEANK